MEEDKSKLKSGWFRAGIVLIFCAISMPFFVILVSDTSFTVTSIGSLGTVGDFFGGSTVGLLSLASICFLIHTIGIQREDLKLTREEFSVGNTTAKVQQIDNAFFNMLSLHHQIVNNIKIEKDSNTYTGREAIEKLKDIYEDSFGKKQYLYENPEKGVSSWLSDSNTRKEYLDKVFGDVDTISQEALDEVYKGFHDEYGNDIGHYMRNNYRIVKFIVNNVANDENEQKKIKEETGREPIIGDKRYYFGMLRAQWSNAEFELILVNSLYTENFKFKNLILKYDVLDIEETKKFEEKDKIAPEFFSLKDSMSRFKAYRKLLEIKKEVKEYKTEKELVITIDGLIREFKKEFQDYRTDITDITNMELDDVKSLNAFINSKAEEAKATQIYTTMLAFGVTILAIVLREIILKYPVTGIIIFLILFFLIYGGFKFEEKRYRKKVQRLYYLSNLLDIYIKK